MGRFNTIEEILEDLKKGKMVIVADSENRENEGDLVMAASFVRPEDINFMAKEARGLICVPMERKRLEGLNLYPMMDFGSKESVKKKDKFSTGWTISCDAAEGITTGISAFDRAHTIQILSDPKTKPSDLIRPGHIFPLQAREGGVLVRAGHTESAIDLMNLAGLYPCAVICEIMNEDGTMARTPELLDFTKRFGLKICTVANLIEYRRKKEVLIRRITETYLPTQYGKFKLILYESIIDKLSHIALIMGFKEIPIKEYSQPLLVRVHSCCLTGDVFSSLRCDCGEQLKRSLEMINKEGRGVILYMNQEGRGIGLVNKILAYHLQDKGLDTVQANEALGFPADMRDYGIGAQILADLGIKEIKLLTNNPCKIIGLEGYGIEIVERISIEVKSHSLNKGYLLTKKRKLGHVLFEKDDRKSILLSKKGGINDD